MNSSPVVLGLILAIAVSVKGPLSETPASLGETSRLLLPFDPGQLEESPKGQAPGAHSDILTVEYEAILPVP